jgi:hypothetical protein
LKKKEQKDKEKSQEIVLFLEQQFVWKQFKPIIIVGEE